MRNKAKQRLSSNVLENIPLLKMIDIWQQARMQDVELDSDWGVLLSLPVELSF